MRRAKISGAETLSWETVGGKSYLYAFGVWKYILRINTSRSVYFFIKCFWILLLFQYSFLPFPPPLPTAPANPTSLPCSHPACFSPCVLYGCSWKPFTLFPPLSPPVSLPVTIHLFLVSMSLVKSKFLSA